MEEQELKKVRLALVGGAIAVLLAACAHGPVVPTPPTVRVSYFNSTLITPDAVRFLARIAIHNNMNGSLGFDRVDYGLSLFDNTLVSRSFSDMKETRRNGDETVTLPITIPMKDILAHKNEIIGNGAMQVTFHGIVYPAQASTLGPVETQRTISIPLPNMPVVTFRGTSGVPLSKLFRVRLQVLNTNSFPIAVDSVETYVDINGDRYRLLHSSENEGSEIRPGESGPLTLSMENAPNKLLGMALSAAGAAAPKITLGGRVSWATPYGLIVIPIEIEVQTTAAG